MIANFIRRYWGIYFFIALNTLFVFFQTFSMQQTRLGDDSLTYLYKGLALQNSFSRDLPSLISLSDYYRNAAVSGEAISHYDAARVTMRHFGSLTPAFDVIPFVTNHLFSQTKWSWFAVEFLIVVIFSICANYFFASVTDQRIASFSLLILSMSLFPGQGLHYFIPGVLCLGVALFQTGLCFRGVIKVPIQFLTSVLILLIHPIGKLYVIFNVGVLVFLQIFKKQPRILAIIQCLVALLISIPFLHLSIFSIEVKQFAGKVSNVDEFLINLYASAKTTVEVFLKNPHFLILGGILVANTRTNALARNLLVSLILCFFGVQLFFIDKNPGELWIRISILVYILVLPFALIRIDQFSIQFSKNFRIWGFALITSGLVFSVIQKFRYGFYNMNFRHEVINESILKVDLQKQAPNKQILVCDTDLTVPLVFLTNGLNNKIVFGKSLKLSDLKQNGTLIGLTPFSQHFNYYSANQKFSLQERFNGILIDNLSYLKIINESDRPVKTKLLMEQVSFPIFVEAKSSYSVNLSQLPVSGKILGLSSSSTMNWDWDKGLSIEYKAKKSQVVTLPLSSRFLLTSYGCSAGLNEIRKIVPISDKSGMLIFEAYL